LPWVSRWAGQREIPRANSSVVLRAAQLGFQWADLRVSRTVVHLVELKAWKSAVL
jgi:hypothetical protein